MTVSAAHLVLVLHNDKHQQENMSPARRSKTSPPANSQLVVLVVLLTQELFTNFREDLCKTSSWFQAGLAREEAVIGFMLCFLEELATVHYTALQ